MLGMVIFVRWFGLGESVLAGALTMSLLILPIIIIATREALRAVSGTIRQAAFALGATRWQTVYAHVLPQAFPGILTRQHTLGDLKRTYFISMRRLAHFT